ncbi:MAG: transposase [bacterium]
MPRKPRIDIPGYLYHIIIRGIEGQIIYRDNQDYKEFLKRLKDVVVQSDGKCFAWALMPNHAHMIIRSGKSGLSDMMRTLLTGYAVYYNIKHKRKGHLFQNRYKSILCDSDTYLLPLVRYVHLNPLKAKLVKSLNELGSFPWTSHRAMLSDEYNSWYERDVILQLFGKTKQDALKNYEDFINDGIHDNVEFEGGELINSKKMENRDKLSVNVKPHQPFDGQILGNSNFIKEISLLQVDNHEPPIEVKDENVSIQEVIERVTKNYGVNKNILLEGNISRRTKNARALIAYIAVNKLGMSNTKVSQLLNMSNSAVCKMLTRNKKEFDRYFDKSIKEIIAF